MLFFPCFGAMKKMITRAVAMRTPPNARNQGARNSFLNASMVETDCSCGPLSAMITAPRMHCVQPIQPKSVSFSLRKKCERMAQMTTESAPSGVCDRLVSNEEALLMTCQKKLELLEQPRVRKRMERIIGPRIGV